jgi:NAD(P)-dependent dehydrogenase (short-subunit alcohol dehydrogenase family)
MKLNDRVAVITGAARGIGKAIAERYVKRRKGRYCRPKRTGCQRRRVRAWIERPRAQARCHRPALIAPGVVDNEHWDHVDAMFAKYEKLKPGEKKRVVGASVPFGRMARPDEIGGLATFLASADADYIVAQTYNIDGGNWMS